MPPELAGRVRLPCLFPRCPVTFKSQHGRTYHIRAVHTNSNLREHHFQEPHNLEGPDLAQMDSEGGDEHQGPIAQRIEHPHLTGMCFALAFLFTMSSLCV